MKTSLVMAELLAILMLMTSASYSALSSVGPTGILNVPTAMTVPDGMFELLVAYDRPKVAGEGIEIFPLASLSYGMPNAEIGVSYFNIRDYTAVKSANVKYIFSHESKNSPEKSGPNIAAGVIYLSGNTAETDFYLVATGRALDYKLFGDKSNTVGTIGLLYQMPNASTASSNLTGMVGLQVGEPGKTSYEIDYIFDDIAAGAMFGVTIRQPLSKNITAQLGVGDGGRYFVGMSMKFGGK